MRYLFVSDIHGEFDKLMTALNEHDFNPDKDTLVVLGDAFDRGPKSLEVLKYIMSLPNCIKIWGNHDRRLRELILGIGYEYNQCDYLNGVIDTLKSFLSPVFSPEVFSKYVYLDANVMINQLTTDSRLKKVYDLLLSYFEQCVWAIELDNRLIATHAWIPTKRKSKYLPIVYEYDGSLLKSATVDMWDDATWSNTEDMITNKCFVENKTLVVGHWHTFRIAEKFLSATNIFNDSGYVIDKDEFSKIRSVKNTIFIDGCANADEGRVLVLEHNSIVEDDGGDGSYSYVAYVEDKKRKVRPVTVTKNSGDPTPLKTA